MQYILYQDMNINADLAMNINQQCRFVIKYLERLNLFILSYLFIQIRQAIERPGLESQRSRKRLFFHRKIFEFFNI